MGIAYIPTKNVGMCDAMKGAPPTMVFTMGEFAGNIWMAEWKER